MHFNADFIKDFLLENFHLENQEANDCLNQRVLCRRILFDFHHGVFAHCRRHMRIQLQNPVRVSNLIPNKIYNKHIPALFVQL
jgi:hypothetical protein